jgi:hypothetical protein
LFDFLSDKRRGLEGVMQGVENTNIPIKLSTVVSFFFGLPVPALSLSLTFLRQAGTQL